MVVARCDSSILFPCFSTRIGDIPSHGSWSHSHFESWRCVGVMSSFKGRPNPTLSLACCHSLAFSQELMAAPQLWADWNCLQAPKRNICSASSAHITHDQVRSKGFSLSNTFRCMEGPTHVYHDIPSIHIYLICRSSVGRNLGSREVLNLLPGTRTPQNKNLIDSSPNAWNRSIWPPAFEARQQSQDLCEYINGVRTIVNAIHMFCKGHVMFCKGFPLIVTCAKPTGLRHCS